MSEQPEHAATVPEDTHSEPEFQRGLDWVLQQAQSGAFATPEARREVGAYQDESDKLYVGREFTLDEFARWFAVQRLGALPFNAVGYHHTETSHLKWAGKPSLDWVFFEWYHKRKGWPWGTGPHLWVFEGAPQHSPGVPRICVGTHPAHDGIGIIGHDRRWLHIEHIRNGDIEPFSEALKRVSGQVLAIVCARHRHADREIPLTFVRNGGVDNPAQPLGIMYHRDQNPNWNPNVPARAWPKTCPGLKVTHENLDADLIRYARQYRGTLEVVEETGSLVAVAGALARPEPMRGGAGEGRQLTAGQHYATNAYTDEGQDVAGSARWFRLADGADWAHASGGVYQPASGAVPGFQAQAGQLTVGARLASVRPGPSRESGEPLRTLAGGTVCAVDGFTDQGQEIGGVRRWYRLAGNAGWVHASGGTVAAG